MKTTKEQIVEMTTSQLHEFLLFWKFNRQGDATAQEMDLITRIHRALDQRIGPFE